MIRLALMAMLAVASVAAQTLADCATLRERGRPDEARRCYAPLASSPEPRIRAEALWALGNYRDANDSFREAVAREPRNPDLRARWGRLFFERAQPGDAAALFTEALQMQPDNPGALLGLALIAADNFDGKAVDLARKALRSNPKLVEAHLLLARVALDQGDGATAVKEAEATLAIEPGSPGAMGIFAARDVLADRPESQWFEKIHNANPHYGEAYALAARLLVLNRRYDEAVQFYRKAIELNPELWASRAELGINLMRIGQDAAAREQLQLCYRNGYQSDAVVNSLRLLDSYKSFQTFQTKRFVLKLHSKEATLLRPYFESEISRALEAYDRKYRVRLERPVQVEVYPEHEDFAVRTLGMPGLGALGVTFGNVVAMDSPSARKKGSVHWASTLWHELSHVYVLSATNSRVPRWFTEGLAVHDEKAGSPEWGDAVTPEIVTAIKQRKLLPVAELDRGFVHQSYPGQVSVSYFQAGRICDFIEESWGDEKIVELIRLFAKSNDTAAVIQEALGVPSAQFDSRFLAWLEKQMSGTLQSFEKWRAAIAELREISRARKYDQVIEKGKAARDLYPEFVEPESVYEMLAKAYLATGNKQAAANELAAYVKMRGRNPDSIKLLAATLVELGRTQDAARALAGLNYIYPFDEDAHRKLGDLCFDARDAGGAVREYAAVVALKPVDKAGAEFNLARAYRLANRMEEAKEHVLLSLESAPGYKPAQKLLLELSQ